MLVYRPGLGWGAAQGSGLQERAAFLVKSVHAFREDLHAFANTESSGQASTELQRKVSIFWEGGLCSKSLMVIVGNPLSFLEHLVP